MSNYQELGVWQKAYGLTLDIYKGTQGFPANEAFGLTSQLRRAGASIPVNIAEGHCRQSRAEYLHFLSIARGSKGELETLLSLAHDLGYLNDTRAAQLTQTLSEVGRMLTRLSQSLRTPRPSPRALKQG